MYRVFLAGGIASGKSTVAETLASLGAVRCDLDQVSREVTEPGSPAVAELAREFGSDIVDPQDGSLRRRLLASRAFASPKGTARLEEIELPHIRERVERLLAGEVPGAEGHLVLLVEVPLLDRVEDLLPEVDEVLCVVCPLATRRSRAIGRGMDAADFDRRVARQPSDDYLRSHADTVFDNSGTREQLVEAVRAWWQRRDSAGWRRV